jgi:hypothetical protein
MGGPTQLEKQPSQSPWNILDEKAQKAQVKALAYYVYDAAGKPLGEFVSNLSFYNSPLGWFDGRDGTRVKREEIPAAVQRELERLMRESGNNKISCIKAHDPPADITAIFYNPASMPPAPERKDFVR